MSFPIPRHTLRAEALTLIKALRGEINEKDFYLQSIDALKSDHLRFLKNPHTAEEFGEVNSAETYQRCLWVAFESIIDAIDEDVSMTTCDALILIKTAMMAQEAALNLRKMDTPFKDLESYHDATFAEARRIRRDRLKEIVRRATLVKPLMQAVDLTPEEIMKRAMEEQA